MAANYNAEPLLEVKGLKQFFPVSKNYTVKAVNDVSFKVYPGETYGLVGESGSGKSTIGRSIIRLYDPTEGTINVCGMDISGKMTKETRKNLRLQMQMIFQDPMASLNPRKKIKDIIGEALDIHNHYVDRSEREARVEAILQKVGLAKEHADRYPHQFSGGMKQRVVIAIALACDPTLLIADEPTTALDVTIQAQVLELMHQLKEKFRTSMIMITHDLGIVAEMCDKVAIMYAGRVVEYGTTADIYETRLHPYTEGLFNSLPDLDSEQEELKVIHGLMPDPTNLPTGCCFHPRCPYAAEECSKVSPEMTEVSPGHFVACPVRTASFVKN